MRIVRTFTLAPAGEHPGYEPIPSTAPPSYEEIPLPPLEWGHGYEEIPLPPFEWGYGHQEVVAYTDDLPELVSDPDSDSGIPLPPM